MNQKLINDLREGKIAVDDCLNKEIVEPILKSTGLPVRNEHKHRYYYRNAFGTIVNNFESQGLPIIPASDFLRPEPTFKVGDRVLIRGKSEQTITGIRWCDNFQSGNGGWSYTIAALNGIGYGEGLLQAVPSPAAEQQFEIGKYYKFRDSENEKWTKAKLLGIIDFEYKYVVIRNGFSVPVTYKYIRPIQPKEITKEDLAGLLADWIELSDNAIMVGEPYTDTYENLHNKTIETLSKI